MKKYEYIITGTIEDPDGDTPLEDLEEEINEFVANDLATKSAVVELKLVEEIVV